jgi:putative hemolysin
MLLGVAWLTAAATAVRSVSRIWLRHWVEQRLHGANAAELYLDRPQRLLLAAATGTALLVFVGGALIGALYPGPPLQLAERVLVAALLVLVVGQLIPRAVSRRWAARLVPVLLPVLRLLDLALTPLLLLARGITRLARREQAPVTPEEAARENIEELLREGELEGVGEHDEIAIITGVVEFGGKTLADVMTPREEVFAVELDTPPAELAWRIAQSGYSRVPVYRGTLDEVAGMVHVFDVLKAGGDVAPPIRPVGVAAASKHCNEQLFDMLRGRTHLAVVRDVEAGRTLGIVTLEDLLEELVGDIRDEHDEPQPAEAACAPGAGDRRVAPRPAPR